MDNWKQFNTDEIINFIKNGKVTKEDSEKFAIVGERGFFQNFKNIKMK